MRTKVRSGAIILRDDWLLLIHRRKEGKEYWVLVGGGVEEGETAEQALVREVKEEAGLTVVSFQKEIEVQIDGIYHILFRCETDKGQPVLGGPEKEAFSKDNWYNLEWVRVEEVAGLTYVYPKWVSAWSVKWIRERGEN